MINKELTALVEDMGIATTIQTLAIVCEERIPSFNTEWVKDKYKFAAEELKKLDRKLDEM